MVVQHNLTAMNANRYLGINNNKLSKSLEKLSSGYAINRAGDNAAGLAVSEKMRSQIAGMTQGVKNAQDGISMVQTFEGALTETHSILQRMKTLADQMANGSYDDPVDRAASQREFLQLNDELNQIADTDFNGVIVLNGGKMADGLKQVDGKFDYANKKDQLMAQAKTMLKDEVNAANQSIKEAKEAMSKQKFDLSANGDAPEWNGLDNNDYDKTAADAIWQKLKITEDATTTGTAKTDVTNELNVTFEYNKAANTWTAVKAVANDGSEITNATDLAAAFATTVPTATPTTGQSGKGGFSVNCGGSGQNVVAVFDSTNAKDGDTVTIKFTNGDNTKMAPNNVAFDLDSLKKVDEGKTELTNGLTVDFPTTKLTDADMTAELAEDYEKLNGLDVSIEYKVSNATPAANNQDKFYSVNIGGNEINVNNLAANAGGDGLAVKINGRDYNLLVDSDTAPTSITIRDAKDTSKELLTISFDAFTAADDADPTKATTGTKGTVSGKIILDTPKFADASALIRADAGENTELGTSTNYQKQLNKAYDTLAKLADVDVSSYEKAKEYLASKGVSTSDAFDKSEAKLTYKDNITLQVGARTKDAVNFTFTYDSDVIGELKGDLDCTAAGLGTDKLTIATQEDANYAIDKIDQAINKVSLIRGNFGAIQNRLEHKIDNMNVSIENLTSAESQIRDTNMPQEMMNFTKQQILAQASQSMLAQANQLPQSVLSLLQ